MTIFNCFFKIINKNRTSMLIYFIIFIVLMLISIQGLGITETNMQYVDTSISIAIIDRDNSILSKALTNYLGERHNIVDLKDDTEILQDALFYRSVEYILIIPYEFEDNFINDSANKLESVISPSSSAGVYVDNMINRYFNILKVYLSSDYDLNTATINTENDLKANTLIEMTTAQSEDLNMPVVVFQIIPYIIMSLIIYAIGPVLMSFNQKDLLQRTECSSISLIKRNMQTALGCIISSFLIWLILMVISFIMCGKEMFSTTSILRIINSFVFLFISISLSFLFGQFIKNMTALSAVNNIVCMGMSFLCGVFVPQELLGEGVLFISKFLPAYWYIKNNDMLTVNYKFSIYLEGIIIQIGFAVAIFVVALVLSRQKKVSTVS